MSVSSSPEMSRSFRHSSILGASSPPTQGASTSSSSRGRTGSRARPRTSTRTCGLLASALATSAASARAAHLVCLCPPLTGLRAADAERRQQGARRPAHPRGRTTARRGGGHLGGAGALVPGRGRSRGRPARPDRVSARRVRRACRGHRPAAARRHLAALQGDHRRLRPDALGRGLCRGWARRGGARRAAPGASGIPRQPARSGDAARPREQERRGRRGGRVRSAQGDAAPVAALRGPPDQLGPEEWQHPGDRRRAGRRHRERRLPRRRPPRVRRGPCRASRGAHARASAGFGPAPGLPPRRVGVRPPQADRGGPDPRDPLSPGVRATGAAGRRDQSRGVSRGPPARRPHAPPRLGGPDPRRAARAASDPVQPLGHPTIRGRARDALARGRLSKPSSWR